MKSLIVLVALMALSMADDSADLQACFEQAKAFKTCAFKSANETIHKNLAQLKGLPALLKQCFEQDGIKGVCTMPTFPPHPAPGSAAAASFQPPAEAVACFNGAKEEVIKCVKAEAGISADFKPQGGAEAHQQQQRPAPFNPPPFPHDPKEISELISQVCNNDPKGVASLKKCALDAIKPFFPALAGVSPMVVGCQAASACHSTNSISDACKAKFEQGAKAFCTCQKKGVGLNFVKTSDTCSAARDTFKEHAAEQAKDAAAIHHNFPQHPNMALDFCKFLDEGKKPEQLCSDLLAKIASGPPKAQ